jgi:hypothetical protein
VIAISDIEEIGLRESDLAALRVNLSEADELVPFGVRQGAQQHRVNNTENCSAGPDSQRQ